MKGPFTKRLIVLLAGLFAAQVCTNHMHAMNAGFQPQSLEYDAEASLPKPDHIVIVILENHQYAQIIGSREAPYINALAKDSFSAVFTRHYIIEHPSQPNYLYLFSGSNQGVTDDEHPRHAPFTTPNLGRQLFDAGLSYATYSEDLPFIGYNGNASGAYVRKHNPSVNWMGSGKNQIPVTTNLPFSSFPADYTQLPTVSIVVPNQLNDMHDGSVRTGDSWVKKHLDGYVQWAKNNNSLFILTFDEDDYGDAERIVTIFTGPMVKGGQYKNTINHCNVLRTIEDMYQLPYAGEAANAKPITNCWR